MGAGVPSREVVGGESEGATQQDLADDAEVLADTGAVGDIGNVYNRLLTFGLVNRNDSYIKKKKDKQQRKVRRNSSSFPSPYPMIPIGPRYLAAIVWDYT